MFYLISKLGQEISLFFAIFSPIYSSCRYWHIFLLIHAIYKAPFYNKAATHCFIYCLGEVCFYWVYTNNHEKCLCSVESEDGVVCEPGCLVLESDFLLSGELEFGDSEIMGLDREAGK